MDEKVRAAMARWPDVPAVYGWLSLSESGEWRLHPKGDATTGSPGEPIGNVQIREFINRNYRCDSHGRWFFQNGPQRVYVRLDAAPYILQLSSNDLEFLTHNGLSVRRQDINGWWLDSTGRLYAETSLGPGLVAGRDVQAVLEPLRDVDGVALFDRLQDADAIDIPLQNETGKWFLKSVTSDALASALRFDPLPHPGPRQ